MSTSFDTAWARLLANEGGYSDAAGDTGGKTRWGITEAVARANGYTGDMRDLPQATAMQIAKADYWTPIRGDELPPELAFQVLDGAYNSGAKRSIQWLQAAAAVDQDGVFGPLTMKAVQLSNPCALICRYNGFRLEAMTTFNWQAFGKGWARRIAKNLRGVT